MDLPIAELACAHGLCVAVRIADDDTGARRTAPDAPFASVDLEHAASALHPAEQVLADMLAPARRRDWVAGRAALRAALHRLDPALVAGPIDSDDRGAPRLPDGWVGSISHKRGLAVALAGRADGWTLGVDVEVDAPPRLDIARRVLTAPEAAAIAGRPADEHGRAVMLHFAIKEAVYKAIDPHLRRYVGFLEVAVAPGDDGRADVTSELPLAIEATWTRTAGLLVCSARSRPR